MEYDTVRPSAIAIPGERGQAQTRQVGVVEHPYTAQSNDAGEKNAG